MGKDNVHKKWHLHSAERFVTIPVFGYLVPNIMTGTE